MLDEETQLRYEKLFLDRIRNWNWASHLEESARNAKLNHVGQTIGWSFLGMWRAANPSGKCYDIQPLDLPDEMADLDFLFQGALNRVAAEHGGFVGSLNDPEDFYFFRVLKNAEEKTGTG